MRASGAWTNNPDLLPTLLIPTYSIPCVKTGTGRSNPTVFRDCPCDLLKVIAKHGFNGNCFRVKENGNCVSEGCTVIRGTKKTWSLQGPDKTTTSIRLRINFVIMQRVPYIRAGGLKDRIIIMSVPSFRSNVWGGRLLISIVFRNSVGYLIVSSSLFASRSYFWSCQASWRPFRFWFCDFTRPAYGTTQMLLYLHAKFGVDWSVNMSSNAIFRLWLYGFVTSLSVCLWYSPNAPLLSTFMPNLVVIGP